MDDTPPPQDPSFEKNLEYFKIIADHFRQDLLLFWSRANFYLLEHAGLFSAFVLAYPSLKNAEPSVLVAIPILGATVSVFWYLVLAGSLFWISKWREEMKRLDAQVNVGKCYCTIESQVQSKPYYSPSKVTGYLPLLFLAIWVTMLVRLAF